jgi:plasmid stability protein
MSAKLRIETAKIETMIRFAQALDEHDKSAEEEQRQIFQDAQAEGVSIFDSLRTRILLKITNGNASLVGKWLSEFEFGGYSDNYEVFAVSLRRVERGEIERGLIGLCLLREHITRSTEIKSSRHLLPVIDKTLTNIDMRALALAGETKEISESEAVDELNSFPLFM